MKDWHRVEVEWHDAHDGLPPGWHEPGDIDRDPYLVRTVGWLVPNHKAGHITVVGSITSHGMVSDATCIPLGMVRRILALNAAQVLPVEPEETADA